MSANTHRRLLVGLAATAMLPAAAPAHAAGPAPAERGPAASTASQSSAAMTRQMRRLVNQVRRQSGVRKLQRNRPLTRAAAGKARKIRDCGQFSHTPCGSTFTATFKAAGFRGRTMGENLAYGGGAAGSPRAILNQWLASPPHRANLLNGKFRMQGIDVRTVSLPGVGRVRLWTHTFGA
jgi:uncharacterized protein YkwD